MLTLDGMRNGLVIGIEINPEYIYSEDIKLDDYVFLKEKE